MMEKFLSCDWGTSALRLRLINVPGLEKVSEKISSKGILETYTSWKETHKDNPESRLPFYLNILNEEILELEKTAGRSLAGIPLVISGMASSTIGLMPLPYLDMPFSTDGSGILTQVIEPFNGFEHAVLLISGVKGADDVMRGEETQLIGVCRNNPEQGPSTYIFPGTHSKHIFVDQNKAVKFTTYMTGEFFELLSRKSILQVNVQKNDRFLEPGHFQSFELGVRNSIGSNLLQAAFRVRANDLFQTLSKTENYFYLSGLIIGTELAELLDNDSITIYLCCGSGLKIFYETALHVLKPDHRVNVLSDDLVDEAVVKGQYTILEQTLKS